MKNPNWNNFLSDFSIQSIIFFFVLFCISAPNNYIEIGMNLYSVFGPLLLCFFTSYFFNNIARVFVYSISRFASSLRSPGSLSVFLFSHYYFFSRVWDCCCLAKLNAYWARENLLWLSFHLIEQIHDNTNFYNFYFFLL